MNFWNCWVGVRIKIKRRINPWWVRKRQAINKPRQTNFWKVLLLSNPSEKYISKQFSNLFNSYTQAFNKQQSRHGSLFSPNFKGVEVVGKKQFVNTLCYIHYNPIHHGFVSNLNDWQFTSFHSYIAAKATEIDKQTLSKLFGSKEAFLKCHDLRPNVNDFLDME